MKTKILILACLLFAQLGYSQTKGLFTEFSINVAAFPKTNDIDGYFKNKYSDYKTSSIQTGGFGFAIGYNFTDRLSVSLDYGLNGGGENYKLKQFKSLEFLTMGLTSEYRFYKTEKNAFSAKIGVGFEASSFNYNRKEPLANYSYSYGNVFIPIALTWWGKSSLGLSLQYNVVISKGNAMLTGVDYKFDNVPNVSLSSLSFGIRHKIGIKL